MCSDTWPKVFKIYQNKDLSFSGKATLDRNTGIYCGFGNKFYPRNRILSESNPLAGFNWSQEVKYNLELFLKSGSQNKYCVFIWVKPPAWTVALLKSHDLPLERYFLQLITDTYSDPYSEDGMASCEVVGHISLLVWLCYRKVFQSNIDQHFLKINMYMWYSQINKCTVIFMWYTCDSHVTFMWWTCDTQGYLRATPMWYSE